MSDFVWEYDRYFDLVRALAKEIPKDDKAKRAQFRRHMAELAEDRAEAMIEKIMDEQREERAEEPSENDDAET